MPSALIRQLLEQHGYPLLTADRLDNMLERETTLALFLTEDPQRFPESNDVAVVLPELVRAFPGRFKPVIVDRALEPQMKNRYDIAVWPCLVFLRDGRFLGKINRVRDWSEYMELIPQILDRQAGKDPGLGIPVISESTQAGSEQAHV